MNNCMYLVLNAEIPVIYIGVSVRIYVKCVVRHSVKRAVLQNINAYIMVNAPILVMYVTRHSVKEVIEQYISAYIVVSALICVKFVIRHSVLRTF